MQHDRLLNPRDDCRMRKIREIEETDFIRCVDIIRLAWPQFGERNSIYHLFSKHFSTTSFVVDEGGELIAFLLGFLSQTHPEAAYIHLVAVLPKHQHRGLATDLYGAFFEAAKRHGRRRVALIVNPDNAPSLEFHRKLGFEEKIEGPALLVNGVRAAKDYNGPGVHMVPFEKQLI
jgi:ribosomal protein S18 acetylase RimI-like enzyme